MPSPLERLPLLLLSTMMLALPARASIIGADGRHSAAIAALPHAAIGSLIDVDSGALCTGTVVAPDIVLTEAHCALRAARPADCRWPHPAEGCGDGALQPRDLRFLADDNAGIARANKYARSIEVTRVLAYGPDYRPGAGAPYFQQRRDDWAYLQLATPLDAARYPPLRIAPADLGGRLDSGIAMPGYSADRYYRDGDPSFDASCSMDYIRRRERGRDIGLIRHDCDSTAGASGSPILLRGRDGSWSVIGMHTDGPDPRYPKQPPGDGNYGTPSSAFYAAYRRLVALPR
ncbi:trypsin-like serine peptidase [Hydrocarboniphaga sp.]|uniref:trypsin-like serine peptidase n=1 Tax=Hydrocarboniphaga sp. TaxID=2033016 RepID=UPI003D131CA6